MPTVGDLRAKVAEPEEAQHLAFETGPDRRLPAAAFHGGVLFGDVADEGQDQAPGQLGGGGPLTAGAGDRDALRGGGGHVDRGVAHAGSDEQLEVGQPGEQGAREGRALAHGHDGFEGREAGRERVFVRDVVAEEVDVAAGRQALPVRHRLRDALVIVQNRDSDHAV